MAFVGLSHTTLWTHPTEAIPSQPSEIDGKKSTTSGLWSLDETQTTAGSNCSQSAPMDRWGFHITGDFPGTYLRLPT